MIVGASDGGRRMKVSKGIKPDFLSWVYNVGDWGKAGECKKTMILIYFLVESHHKQSRVYMVEKNYW